MPIRVLVVDDSVLFRTRMQLSLGKGADIQVVGCATDTADATDRIAELSPDVVTLDIEMPGKNGIDYVKELMVSRPLPVIVVSSLYSRMMDAISAGAVEFARKPESGDQAAFDHFIRDLQEKIVIAASADLHIKKKGIAACKPAAPAKSALANQLAVKAMADVPADRVLAIGASTGGTEAILAVVQHLPANSPGVVVVQHMPANFTRLYAERLDKICPMHVREAADFDRVVPGTILIAAGEFHLRLKKDAKGYYVRSERGEKVSGHCPSVDVLFHSVAETAADKALGVLLTGMGADGASGLLAMRQAGAYTIGQDKSTSVVYGMPMEAYKMGAVCRQLPLDLIADEIIYQLSSGRKA